MDKKIGIFGGTFNPIHFGHINLALEVLEKYHLDEIWFCPSHINPLKLKNVFVTGEHRLEMTRLGIEGISQFKMLDIEVKQSKISYTVETLRRLTSSEFGLSSHQLFFIMGEDAFIRFFEWREPEEVLKLATLIIGTRLMQDPSKLKEVQARAHVSEKSLIATRILEISSTELRERLRQGLYCGHLLPPKVVDYIYEHHLY